MAAWVLGLSLHDIRAVVEDDDANENFLVVLDPVEADAPELLLTGRELFRRALILGGVEQPLRVGIRARSQLQLGRHVLVVLREIQVLLVLRICRRKVEGDEAADHLVIPLSVLLLQSFHPCKLILVRFLVLLSVFVSLALVRTLPRLRKIPFRAVALQRQLPGLLYTINRGIAVTDLSEDKCWRWALRLKPQWLFVAEEVFL